MKPTNQPCADLVSFADGELEPERAEAFRSHLSACDICQRELVETMELGARLSTLPRNRGRRRTVWRALGFGGVLAAATVAALLHRWVGGHEGNVFAEQQTRPYEVRLAYRDAASYRAPRGEMLGASSPPGQRIAYADLDELQKRGDDHGLAIARAWNGEKLDDIIEELGKLAPTSSVQSDRTAFQILITSNDNVEPILAELELLRGSTDIAVAHAARWNYALVLSRLALALSAASEFRAIAEDREAGWSDEASKRARDLETLGRSAEIDWRAAVQAGEALVHAGTPVSRQLVQRFPGVMRAYFYNAVRTAPTPERVRALSPIAVELDQIGGQPLLASYLRRVADLDFRRRARLASGYAALLRGAPASAELEQAIAATNPAADVADIVMGAMVELDAIPKHLEQFRTMAARANDPWFELVLAGAAATADVQHGDWLGAEAQLRTAQSHCTRAVEYQCLALASQLGHLYQDLHRVPEAITVLLKGLASARGSGEWGKYRDLMKRLADVERFNTSTATCRAYAHELLQLAPRGSEYSRAVYMILVGAALLDVDGKAARRALDLASPDTAGRRLAGANYLADIGRLDPQPGDLAQLQSWLASWQRELSATGALTKVHQMLADEIEGRLRIESDRSVGSELLQRAIVAARALPGDVDARRVRAGAYSVLVFDAARHEDYAHAMSLIAQELDLPPPGACTVAMVAEDERAAIVVRSSDGQYRAAYEPARHPRDGALTISPELSHGLEGCRHVWVMARAALQGQPRVLPAALPWSYVTGAGEHVSPPASKMPGNARTLIVTDVTPPAELRLPPLSRQSPDRTASTTTVLSGPKATPARVLDEMRDASIIRFHTHALMDAGISDASYLVLSGDDGKFQLTAEAIRRIKLERHPIVVLAACNAAQGARYQHTPWSLPHAFLAVGARAVFAAGAAIPDLEAEPFFTRVLDRIAAGADPAVALRDERLEALAGKPSSWAADVMLFE